MKIGLISRTDRSEAVDLVKEIASLLHDHELFFDKPLSAIFGGPEIVEVDILIAVGGDGTILKACKEYGDIPILTVNMGTFGFLCELEVEEITKIPALLEDYELDCRGKLAIYFEGRLLGNVLNEVVVRSTSPIKIDYLSIIVEGEEPYDVRGDGVIVATPTGSTAYSLSAGGSLLHPEANVFMITPISPLFREWHPYVVPDDLEIEIVNLGKDSYVILDGQPIHILQNGESIIVCKSSEVARFIRRRN
ncbi:MAG: NAD(+)/NADH kinase [Candidatus Methanofastidiosa archaeon]|nr:NAD(+)/NADH kinase [Candidatus Methanofastidiosa archaeon]